MASRIIRWLQGRWEPQWHDAARNPAIIVPVYVTLYVALDRISVVQALPGIGFDLWNPSQALSLALLVIKGLCYAPAVFVAGAAADGLVDGFPLGIQATLAADAIGAAGYAVAAALLRRFAHAGQGFPRVADIAWLLLIAGIAAMVVNGIIGALLVMLHALPAARLFVSVRQQFIGDLTGIVGLFPVLMTIPQARDRWKEVSPFNRIFDSGIFAFGLGLALWVVFYAAHSKELHFFYLLLLPVVWIGVRHGLPWCAPAILVEQGALISTLALLDYPMADFLAFQFLSLAIAATGLVLGAAVTERQRTELCLRQQQAELGRTARLTTAGALGATVVHEISQPLATVATYAHTCRRLLTSGAPDLEQLDEMLAKVESEVRRAGEIIERLRDFVSRSEPRWSAVDLAEVTRKVVGLLADEARSRGVNIRIEARPLRPVAADRTQIEQVLVNLIRNAIEAVADCDERERRVRIRLRHVDREVEVAVEDNGPGVSPDIADRAFEPFETSKRRGMGLGLPLSREIVKAHGGRLWWDATVAPGARFVLRLPGDRIERP